MELVNYIRPNPIGRAQSVKIHVVIQAGLNIGSDQF